MATRPARRVRWCFLTLKFENQELQMKNIFALLLTAIVALTSPFVLADQHGKGKGAEKSEMKGDNASDMGKQKREEGKAKAEMNKEKAKAKDAEDDDEDDEEEKDDE
jgi:hypothetical protein